MKALDLFAGPGGWSLACQRLGITEHGIEKDAAARATREAAGFLTVHDDVTTYVANSGYDILIASPPCQTFSVAGKGKGRLALDVVCDALDEFAPGQAPDRADLTARTGDERTALVMEPIRYISQWWPPYIALEQVPTVLPVWHAYTEWLEHYHYHVWTGLVHAEQFGVPQTRRRAILLAANRRISPPEPTHSRYYPRSPSRLDMGVEPWVSMADALGWGPPDRPSYTVTGGGTETGGAEPFARGAREVLWPYQRPATTVVGSFKPEILAAPGYRTTVSRQNAPGSVKISVAEAGVLQTFPPDFPWQGSKTKQYQQVGNAIPPLLAQHLLTTLIKDNA